MIRDPSDGSVKEIIPDAYKINAVTPKSQPEGIIPDTGLRQPTRTDAQERMDRSREWLKQYHKPKDEAHAGGFSGTHPQDGDSGDDQGRT